MGLPLLVVLLAHDHVYVPETDLDAAFRCHGDILGPGHAPIFPPVPDVRLFCVGFQNDIHVRATLPV